MRDLIIGDLHIGIKNNSLTWLESQLDFFDKQIFKTIEEKNIERVIFLGDIYDIRYSINQQVGLELQKKIREMLEMFPHINFYMVAGNHDYYSPLEEFAEYNVYNILFPVEFLQIHQNLKIINKDPYLTDDGCLMLPWYWTENPDHIDELLYNYDFTNEVSAIFCHTDLTTWPGARIASFKGTPIYSGHIHFIVEDQLCNLHNIGASIPLTFNDVNQDRYIYILEDHIINEKIKNITTPQFKRAYNEQIFELIDEYFENSYVQLCISSTNVNKAKYVEHIKEIKNKYINSNIRLHIIDDNTNLDTLTVDGFNTNLETYIEQNIPEHLDDKYNLIKQKLQEQ
jgi:hypothetical protein